MQQNKHKLFRYYDESEQCFLNEFRCLHFVLFGSGLSWHLSAKKKENYVEQLEKDVEKHCDQYWHDVGLFPEPTMIRRFQKVLWQIVKIPYNVFGFAEATIHFFDDWPLLNGLFNLWIASTLESYFVVVEFILHNGVGHPPLRWDILEPQGPLANVLVVDGIARD